MVVRSLRERTSLVLGNRGKFAAPHCLSARGARGLPWPSESIPRDGQGVRPEGGSVTAGDDPVTASLDRGMDNPSIGEAAAVVVRRDHIPPRIDQGQERIDTRAGRLLHVDHIGLLGVEYDVV